MVAEAAEASDGVVLRTPIRLNPGGFSNGAAGASPSHSRFRPARPGGATTVQLQLGGSLALPVTPARREPRPPCGSLALSIVETTTLLVSHFQVVLHAESRMVPGTRRLEFQHRGLSIKSERKKLSRDRIDRRWQLDYLFEVRGQLAT